MKSILEKAIVHLLNGDQAMAETLFHKFMVERARQIHESLRQGEVELSENWDSEIREEEFFGDEDLEDEEGAEGEEGEGGDEFAPSAEGDAADADVDAADADMDAVDADADADDADMDADMDADADMGMAPEGELGEKIDNLESKIDELTAEFDRMMAELEGEHHSEIDDLGDEEGVADEGLGDEGLGDEEGLGDLSGETDLGSDMGGEGSEMGGEDTGEIADRMEDDFGDEGQPEHKMAEDFSMSEEDDDMMEDITESIIAELEKITAPSNTEGKEIGSGGKTVSGNRKDNLPHHPVEQRYQQAKPYLVKADGDAHNDSFERETPPTSKKVKSRRNNDAGVKHLQRVQPKGDPKAALNHDYVNRPTTKSPLDGKASK